MNPRAIDLIFKNLMFFYNTTAGLHVFVPAAKHRARLRDTWTGAEVPLSQSLVTLEVDGKVIPTGTPLRDPCKRVVRIEWLNHNPEGEFVTVPSSVMDETTVPDSLCAHVRLGGGHLTAYPLAMFPEKADDDAMFERTAGQPEGHRITDTLGYHLDLGTATKAELIVRGPRRERVTFDVTAGGRFEIYNEDDKIGAMDTEAGQRKEEMQTILKLLGKSTTACDLHACAGFFGGDPDAGDSGPKVGG